MINVTLKEETKKTHLPIVGDVYKFMGQTQVVISTEGTGASRRGDIPKCGMMNLGSMRLVELKGDIDMMTAVVDGEYVGHITDLQLTVKV